MIRLNQSTLVFAFGLILSLAIAGSDSSFAGELEVHLEIARDTIVQNDCQVALVTVTNHSDDPVQLDQPFHLLACGPKLELRAPGKEVETINSLMQSNEHCNEAETKDLLMPGKSLAEYLVLSGRSTGKRIGERLFDIAGKYELRASISVKGTDIVSETRGVAQVACNLWVYKRHGKFMSSVDTLHAVRLVIPVIQSRVNPARVQL